MRIGIVPNLDRSAGGVYQYAVTMLEALGDLDTADEFVVFTYGGEFLPPGLEPPGPVIALRRAAGPLGRLGAALAVALRPGAVIDNAWRRFFLRHRIDLLVFTADNDLATRAGIPYVVAIHDIQHRLHPEFPEVSAQGEWERREQRMRTLIAGASVVLVDSEVGRADVLEHYGDTGIAPDAVRPLPFRPAHYLGDAPTDDAREAVRKKYGLRGEYLFYPAQLWPHKNHRRLVEALGILSAQGIRLPLVLAGSRSGELRARTYVEMMEAAAECGVEDLVHYLGYVPDDEMSALYAEALALVMPTFFGPTNIPALEAFQLSCPVITSDIRGIREHVGGAALLVDPESPDSMAAALARIAGNPNLREELVIRGRAWLDGYTRDDYVSLLHGALQEAKTRVETGAK